MSCHDAPVPGARADAGAAGVATAARPAGAVPSMRVVLVGNPNVGKSTLFNALTGARQHVTNAPGTTVELQVGTWRGALVDAHGDDGLEGVDGGARRVQLVDLPGTYSLVARSPDEQVTADAVSAGREPSPRAIPSAVTAGPAVSAGRAGDARPAGPEACDLAVVLVDAAALTRSLYLLGQVASLGCPVVVALTMTDVAAARGIDVDVAALSDVLGVPVVGTDPRAGTGLGHLTATVVEALRHVPPATAASGAGADREPGPGAARDPRAPAALGDPRRATVHGLDRVPGLDALTDASALFTWVAGVVDVLPGATAPAAATGRVRTTWSDRVDRVLLDRRLGLPVLLVVLWGLFELATAVAGPLVGAVGDLVNGPVADAVRALVPGPAWLDGLLVDGLLAGVGTVLSFAPLMALMFLAIALLEDCGYLARAAFVADRAMRTLGLDGRAVLPLVVGFGCNVPALTATRSLPSARQRLLTGLLVPYTSCSARLTVYVLLASVFFPDHAGTVIFLMYLASVALVVLGGLVLRVTAFRDLQREPLVLVLPAYQRPRLRALLLAAGVRVQAFVVKAGRIIVVTLTVVWVLVAVPAGPGHTLADVPVEESLYGSAARALAPVLAPAGTDDWHVVAALATGIVAKEVVVGSFAQSYALAEPVDPADGSAAARDLGTALRATFTQTSGGHPGAAAAGFMVLVLAYTPCLATIAEQRRLFGVRWTLGAVVVQLVVAWGLSVLVFQVGRLL